MKSGYNSGQVPPRNTSMVDQDQHSGVSERGSCGVVPTAQLSCHQRLRDSCEVHGGLTGSPGQLAGGWRVGSRGPSRGERKGEAVQLLIRPATNPLVTAPSSPSLLELLVILFLVLSQVTFRHAPPSPHRTLLRRCHPPLIHSKVVCSHFPTTHCHFSIQNFSPVCSRPQVIPPSDCSPPTLSLSSLWSLLHASPTRLPRSTAPGPSFTGCSPPPLPSSSSFLPPASTSYLAAGTDD